MLCTAKSLIDIYTLFDVNFFVSILKVVLSDQSCFQNRDFNLLR